MRLLIFTPTWIDPATQEDAIAPECEAAIKSQALRDGYDFDWHVTADNPCPIGDLRNVLYQYQQAREYFFCGKWDALLTIEHDNVLPDSGAVQRLIDTLETFNAEVVYAPYKLRHGHPVLNTLQYINDRNLGLSLTNYPRELMKALEQRVWRISGTGMGCTLFSRAAIERIPFGKTGLHNPAPDMHFSQMALKQQLLMVGRFDVPVLHLSEGRWLHPFRKDEIKMKYLALQTVNIMVEGNPLKLTAGEIVELSPALAQDWQRAGYLEPLAVPAPTPEPPPIEAAVLEPPQQADAPAQTRRPRRKAGAA